jgi:hypothetical protein
LNKSSVRDIFLLWICWATILLGFQWFLNARIADDVLIRSADLQGSIPEEEPYLTEPFMNNAVAWDSEYYLSIAINGYDDPYAGYVQVNGKPSNITMNYARFPLYPILIRILSQPLKFLGLNPIATATLAGILISLIGTLAGMLALYDLASPSLGEDGAYRAIYYLLIYPTGFYLAQVYTEGLFIGCAFSSLALMHNSLKGNRYMWFASILAALATLTRAVGISLVLAIIVSQFAPFEQDQSNKPGLKHIFSGVNRNSIVNGFKYAILPLAAYLTWAFSPLGEKFQIVMDNFFGAKTLGVMPTIAQWITVVQILSGKVNIAVSDPAHTTAYYLLEILTLLLALIAGIRLLKTQAAVAVFSLASLAICLFTSLPYGFPRYTLAMPATFLFLGQLGKSKTFDRAWIIASLLLMGLLVTLYTLNLWVD